MTPEALKAELSDHLEAILKGTRFNITQTHDAICNSSSQGASLFLTEIAGWLGK
jgi:hypothetical protein